MELGRTLTIARHNDNTPADATNPAEYAFVCGGRSRSFDMSASRFDRTIPNLTNPGAPLVKAEGSGIQNRTFQISGLQINNAAGIGMLEDARQARDWYYLISIPGWGDFSGKYNVSVTLAGELEGDMTYDANFSLADGSTEAFTAESGLAPDNTVLPAITGTAEIGETLTASNGTWTGTPAYTYQWFSGGESIPGATSSTYVIQAGDEGKVITVQVTAANAAGTTSATSAATVAVTAGS